MEKVEAGLVLTGTEVKSLRNGKANLEDAYAEVAPLSGDERAAVPDAMLCRVATLVWYVATRHGERVPGDVGGAPRYAARAAEIDRLVPAIREAAGA